LYLQLQSCFILAFDLLQNARCDEPLHARVDIAVEPADIADFEDIFRGKSPKKKVQGMVQVNTFTVVTGVDSRAARRLEIWRRERARADAAGFHADAIGSIQVSVSDGYAESGVDASIRIYSALKESVPGWINGGCAFIDSSTGAKTTIPFTVENCMQYLVLFPLIFQR
jgi:hypothetical protein